MLFTIMAKSISYDNLEFHGTDHERIGCACSGENLLAFEKR
jgi:hypothetical protein